MSDKNFKETPQWKEHTKLGSKSFKHIEKIAKNLILLIEEEKRITEEKIKRTKELLERMKSNR